jgi:hypothetical protein
MEIRFKALTRFLLHTPRYGFQPLGERSNCIEANANKNIPSNSTHSFNLPTTFSRKGGTRYDSKY